MLEVSQVTSLHEKAGQRLKNLVGNPVINFPLQQPLYINYKK